MDLYTNDLGDGDSEPSQTSDSYTVPGSSGMKETHIFTPIKPNTSSDASLPSSSPSPSPPPQPLSSLVSNGMTKTQRNDIPLGDVDQFSSDTIVIKENVVKKEYRDVEYEPNKLIASADDFTEFQFVQPTIAPNNAINEPNTTLSTANPSNPIILSNSIGLSNSTSVSNSILQPNSINNFLSDLSTDKIEPDKISNDGFGKSASYLDSFENSTFKSLPSIDYAANKISSNVDSLSNGNRSDFEFYSLNDNFITSKNIPVDGGILNTNNFGCATDSMEIFSISSIDQKHAHTTTNTSQQNTQSISSLHSAPISQPNNLNTAIHSMNSNNFATNTGILTPQTAASVQPQLAMMNNKAMAIQWPEPGINSDQLEQFEKRFFSAPSESKCNNVSEQNAETNTDDEWSDFVSVVQPQTPITNILNKNLLKQQQQSNDEDDWSEFVSSTPSNLQRFTSNITAPPVTNSNYESMFKSWNTTFQTATSQQSSLGNFIVQPNVATMRQQHQQPICTIESNIAFQTAQKPIAPSIISLPDLGFVAPKSLVNMPNISKAKK